jgi:hypothetical protein
MEDKHIITKEMLEGLSSMIQSEDKGDVDIALTILENRDTEDPESVANWEEMKKLIVRDKDLFPTGETYVIKINGRLLKLKGSTGFPTEKKAKEWLARHLSQYLGTKSSGPLGYSAHIWVYDPATNRNIPNATPYFYTIKKIFGSGVGLRDFLIKNKIATVEKVS